MFADEDGGVHFFEAAESNGFRSCGLVTIGPAEVEMQKAASGQP